MENKEKDILKCVDYHCPRYKELPDIPLYLDQLMDIARTATAPVMSNPVTGPMINNYVKLKVLPAAVKKKYNKEQLCYLIVITLLKDVFTLPQIAKLFEIQRKTYPLEVAYDYFCTEFENALAEAFDFTGQPLPSVETKRTDQTILIRSMVLAATNRIFVEKAYLNIPEGEAVNE